MLLRPPDRPAPTPLTAELAFRDDAVVVSLAGALERASALTLDRVGRRLVHRGLQVVVVDAAEITQVDLAGLWRALDLCPAGARLRLRRPSRCVLALVRRSLDGGALIGRWDGDFGEVRAAEVAAGDPLSGPGAPRAGRCRR